MAEEGTPPEFLIVGRIAGPWGRIGEVKVEIMTDFPDRFEPGKVLYADGTPLELESSRPHKEGLVVKFTSVNSIEEAEGLRGLDLGIPRSEMRHLPEGEYYPFQLIGLKVVTTGGKFVGRIVEIMSSAGSDIYVALSEHGETLIPAIEDVIREIDLDKREMLVEEIEGLLTT